MKTLISSAILLLAFAVCVYAKPHRPPLPPHIKEARDACLKELDTTEEDYHKGKKNGQYKTEDCLEACVHKKLGIIGEDGKIDKEIAKTNFPPHVPEENVTRIVDACYEQKGENDCQTAALYKNCIKKLRPRPPMHQEMEKIKTECKTELSLTDEDIKKLRDTRDKATEDCFLLCIGSKFGFLNKDGTLNKDKLVEKSPAHKQEKVGTVSDECAKENVGANACETALNVHKCFGKNDLKFGHYFGPPPPPPEDE